MCALATLAALAHSFLESLKEIVLGLRMACLAWNAGVCRSIVSLKCSHEKLHFKNGQIKWCITGIEVYSFEL